MWWVTLLVVLGVIVVLITSSIVIGNMTFKRKVRGEAERLLQQSQRARPQVVTEVDLQGLPEPVQRYLKHSQIIGKERIQTVRLKQKGSMRMKEGQKWTPLEAEEYYTTDPPAFIWSGSIEFIPFLSVKARDMLSEGEGRMSIKLLGLISIANASGPEMNQASLVRYLSEIIWFPTAFLSEYMQWEPIDSSSAKATISVNELTASAVFYFNESGELENFIADRYRDDNGAFVLEKWSTPITEYKEINGVRIPRKGDAIYNLSSGDFKYIQVELTDIEYNNPFKY